MAERKKAREFDPADITTGPISPYIELFDKYRGMKAGVWRQVAESEAREGAKALLFRLRKRPDVVGKGVWEFAVQRLSQDEGEGSRLMVRYMGRASKPHIQWWSRGKLIDEVPADESKAKSEAASKQWRGADKGKGRMTEAEKRRAKKRARG